jgi:hypothetical protein
MKFDVWPRMLNVGFYFAFSVCSSVDYCGGKWSRRPCGAAVGIQYPRGGCGTYTGAEYAGVEWCGEWAGTYCITGFDCRLLCDRTTNHSAIPKNTIPGDRTAPMIFAEMYSTKSAPMTLSQRSTWWDREELNICIPTYFLGGVEELQPFVSLL